MRVDRGRAVLLAMLVAVAGVVPGSGAVAGAAPAGFTIACEAGTSPGWLVADPPKGIHSMFKRRNEAPILAA